MNAENLSEEKEVMIPPRAEISMQAALLEIVQRKDIDPDRLERFLDLQIKMENRQAEQAFSEAMANFQGECPIIKKTKKVSFMASSGKETKYNYSPLDEIVHIIKPIMQKHGLSFTFNEVVEAKMTNLITTIRHKKGHSEKYDHRFPTVHDDARMNESQRMKSALSFAKRAALENALGIVTAEEDDDARRAVDNSITQGQLDEIMTITSTSTTPMKELLAYLKVKDLKDLTEYEAKKAIMALKQKRAACLK